MGGGCFGCTGPGKHSHTLGHVALAGGPATSRGLVPFHPLFGFPSLPVWRPGPHHESAYKTSHATIERRNENYHSMGLRKWNANTDRYLSFRLVAGPVFPISC